MPTNFDLTCDCDGERGRHDGSVVQEDPRQSGSHRGDHGDGQPLRVGLEKAGEGEVLHEDEDEDDEDEDEVELEVAPVGTDVVQGAHDALQEEGSAEGAVVILHGFRTISSLQSLPPHNMTLLGNSKSVI